METKPKKYKWKRAFKRTTSGSKRGLIKKNIKPDEHFILMIQTVTTNVPDVLACDVLSLLRELRV